MKVLSSRPRRSRAVLRLGTSVFAAVVSVAAVAFANPTLPVRIAYSGDGACGDGTGFREAVRRKAPELVDAGAEEPARDFVVSVSVRPDGNVEGKVAISEPSGAAITRRLEGDDCGEVIEALAFIVAELGRAVRLEPEGEPIAAPAPAAPAPTTTVAVSPKSDAHSKGEPTKAEPRTKLFWEAGAGLSAVYAPTPDWVPAPFAYLELGYAPDGVFRLFSGRVSFLYATSGTISGTIGDAEIVWATGRAELCGPRFGGVLSASGCLSFDAGVLEGRGSRATDPKTERTVWLSPGLTVRGHFVIERTLVLGLEAGGFIAQVRPRFYFSAPSEPDTIHEVPWVGFRAGLGLGVLFP